MYKKQPTSEKNGDIHYCQKIYNNTQVYATHVQERKHIVTNTIEVKTWYKKSLTLISVLKYPKVSKYLVKYTDLKFY